MEDERAKKDFDHSRAGNGGVSAIAKQKVFGVHHKEIKSHVSKVKKLLVRRTLPTPDVNLIAKSTMLLQAPEDNNYSNSLLPKYLTNRKGEE